MRTPVAVLALGLTLAIGTPTAWALTRPEPAAGVPVVAALAAPTTAPAPTVTPLPVDRLPEVTARPAVPLAAPVVVPPVRLSLPARGIEAPVDPVGVEPEGEMTLPADVDRVGWYSYGPVPGAAEGAAVLAGHVDDVEQGLGALAPLREAQPGDEVVVEAADGTTTRWTVTGRETLDKPGVPLGELFARTGAPRLVLITCGGPFDADLRTYRDNVVVVAEPTP
ncbi:class F sortase [Modestobacter sp. VKM Ac-2986]|uniref:class F sortase n=1 Tax=Modestobacter sp. VKM Ac-2986 TaxID=3004140 RepID=UPI0022AB93E7|nr:class F sortase [Modestobacter sp. VKM Ac-2986]MCZ2831024.1 class F sortase [Modestobacter sp. VKM Ac-2986]